MKTKHEVMAGHKRNANKRNIVFKLKKKLHHSACSSNPFCLCVQKYYATFIGWTWLCSL